MKKLYHHSNYPCRLLAFAESNLRTQGLLPVGNFDDLGQDIVRGILHGYAVDQGTSGWDAGYGYGSAAHAYS